MIICKHCGAIDQALCDYYEDEWYYWCGFCGYDMTIQMEDEEEVYGHYENEPDRLSEAKGEYKKHKVPRLG